MEIYEWWNNDLVCEAAAGKIFAWVFPFFFFFFGGGGHFYGVAIILFKKHCYLNTDILSKIFRKTW